MSLMSIRAIQTFVTCDHVEVEKATMVNFPENAIGIIVQEYHWGYYRDVFGATMKESDILSGWNVNLPMKKAYKYQHPIYGKLRFISPRIELNLLRSYFKYSRILEAWSA